MSRRNPYARPVMLDASDGRGGDHPDFKHPNMPVIDLGPQRWTKDGNFHTGTHRARVFREGTRMWHWFVSSRRLPKKTIAAGYCKTQRLAQDCAEAVIETLEAS